jgi:hypothetical protein
MGSPGEALLEFAVKAGLAVGAWYIGQAYLRGVGNVQARFERHGFTPSKAAHFKGELFIDHPRYRGTLVATCSGARLFEQLVFSGTTAGQRSPWSVQSRRLFEPGGEATLVHLPDPDLERRFVAAADRPKDVLAFLDAATRQLLMELDTGGLRSLLGKRAGVQVSVWGDEVDVTILGQSGSEEEHISRALRLIERAAEHGLPPAGT